MSHICSEWEAKYLLAEREPLMWTLGVKIGLPIALALALVCVGGIMYFRKREEGQHNAFFDKNRTGVMLWSLGLAAVVVFTLVLFYPYSKPYHYWTPAGGTVTDVSSRILGSSDSVSQKFVVLIDGQEYGCNDTRCALIEVGDTVELDCLRTWQYSGADGFDCNFISRTSAAKPAG